MSSAFLSVLCVQLIPFGWLGVLRFVVAALPRCDLLFSLSFRGTRNAKRTTPPFRADVMYWDDLGQTYLTGPASEMLLHLVEERTCRRKPILATTQYSGEKMDAQFERKEMGQAVRRRLN